MSECLDAFWLSDVVLKKIELVSLARGRLG